VFGFSFGEILVISLVALVAVGPQKLPGMLKTMGMWARKLRKMTMDVRQQTGIDEMLRAEGIQLSELRSLMRGYHDHSPFTAPAPAPVPTPAPAPVPAPVVSQYEDPYGGLEPDPTREYPLEGADAYGALPDDLLEPGSDEVATAPGAPPAPEPQTAAEPEPAATEAAAPSEPTVTEASAAGADSATAAEASPELPEVEPESASEPKPVVRSAPPPPPSRGAVPRPSSGPPPAPRRPSAPSPEPSSPSASKPEASASVPSSPGTVNGNG
jgi:sec-independent protein translocase protein TatB